jgi:hypothetical protein
MSRVETVKSRKNGQIRHIVARERKKTSGESLTSGLAAAAGSAMAPPTVAWAELLVGK